MEREEAVDREELAEIITRWGETPQRHYVLDVDHPFLSGENQMLVSHGRRAEICYVMTRGALAGGVLLHIKRFYPADAYRLPTGGIHCGEGVEETLAREIAEETGLTVGTATDQVHVHKFLGICTYEFRHKTWGRSCPFATYHFLVEMPAGAVLNPQDPAEEIGGWRWCPPGEIVAVADFLHSVGHVAPRWADWGRYRALSHRFVADALRGVQ